MLASSAGVNKSISKSTYENSMLVIIYVRN